MIISEVDINHIKKWPEVAKLLDERPEYRAFIAHEDSVASSIVLAMPGRIMHVYTDPESRRGGSAKSLVNYCIHNFKDSQGCIRAVVDPTNKEALHFFLDMDFRIIGFDVSWSDNRYLMEYGSKWMAKVEDRHAAAKADIADCLDKMYLIETLPIRI